MNPASNPFKSGWPLALERACLGIVASIAAIELFGRWFSVIGKHLPQGWDLMKANTAAGMLAAVASLWLSSPQRTARQLTLSRTLAGLLMLLAVVTLIEYLDRGSYSIDALLVTAAPSAGRMSPQTALGFLLLGIVLFCARPVRYIAPIVADICAFALIALVLILVSGYVYDARGLFGTPTLSPTSPQSVLCFVLLTPLIVMRRAQDGVFAPLVSADIGGRITLITIPVAIIAIYATGFLFDYLTLNGLLSQAYAVAFSVSALVFVVICLILMMSRLIHSFESRLKHAMEARAQDMVKQSEQRYADLVEQAISGFVIRRPDGQLLLVNEGYVRMTGYTREELLKLKATNLVVDQGVLERVRVLEVGQSAHIETFLKRKDGSLLEVEYVTQRLRDGNLQSVLLDVSERKRVERARAESEERYTDLFERAIMGIIVRRRSGEITLVNEALCHLTGYTRDELLHMSAAELQAEISPASRSLVEGLSVGESVRVEISIRRKDGSHVEIESVTQRLPNGDLQSMMQDVSERKQAEDRFRAMVEGAPNAMVMVDERGSMSLVNSQTERQFGYERGELIGQAIEMLIPSRFRGHHPALRQGYVKAPEVRAMGAGRELFGLRKDGSEMPVEIGLNPITTRQGRFVLASIIDITERKRAEHARELSERRYIDLVEQALEGIMVRKSSGELVFVNNTFARMLGYDREELLNLTIHDVVHPGDAETTQQVQQLGDDGHLRLKKRMLRKDREVIYVDVSAKRLHNGDIQTTVQDITEQHAAEERERTYTEELRQMSRRLSEAQETERRAIARELHDEVGQSLTATRINLRDLEQEAEGGPFAERLTAASSIISELLSKVRQMSLDLHPSVLDDLGLAPALRWCVRTRVTESKLEVVLDMPEELPRFDGMAEITLFRVFQEALSNVLRHAEARHVIVKLRHVGGRLDLSVKDDGRGFDTTAARRHAISGKSLGLLGMEERVRLAGGEIMFESVPGKGTELRVSVPANLRQG